VQDFRARYPPVEQRSESLPPVVCTLTAAYECLIPQPVDALPEGAQLPGISGHRVVLVVAVDDLPKSHAPTSLGRACIRRRSSTLMALSFATIRFFAVIRQTVKLSVLWRRPQ